MNDPNGESATTTDDRELNNEISRSMGSVWLRHTGERPSSVSTEIALDKVKCVIAGPEAAAVAEAQADSEDGQDADGPALLTLGAQKSEAIESVRRATHRRVVGFISKRDDSAGTSTQTFILDARNKRN